MFWHLYTKTISTSLFLSICNSNTKVYYLMEWTVKGFKIQNVKNVPFSSLEFFILHCWIIISASLRLIVVHFAGYWKLWRRKNNTIISILTDNKHLQAMLTLLKLEKKCILENLVKRDCLKIQQLMCGQCNRVNSVSVTANLISMK